MTRRKQILGAAGAAIVLLSLAPTPAAAQSGGRNEYAVKFVCGTNSRPLSAAAAAGTYFTAVNIHNPFSESVPLAHKVALAASGRTTRPTSITSSVRLGLDEAVDIDCEQISRLLASSGIAHGPFFTGFYVIQSPSELDVVAVYTAAGSRAGGVTTMHTERVPVRRRG